MDRFAALLQALTPETLTTFLAESPEAEQFAALSLLAGQRPKRMITLPALRTKVTAEAGIATWLHDAALAASGDPCEVLALLQPPGPAPGPGLSEILTALRRGDTDAAALPHAARALAYRLATGGFRKTLPMPQIVAALARITSQPQAALALRLARGWPKTARTLADLTGNDPMTALHPDPLPPPAPIPDPPESLGKVADWAGVILNGGKLVQLVLAGGEAALWDLDGGLIALDAPESLLAFAPKRIGLLALLPAAVPPTIASLRPIDALSVASAHLPKGLADRRKTLTTLLRDAGRTLPLAPLTRQGDWSQFAEDARQGGLLILNNARTCHHWPAPRPRFRAVLVAAMLSATPDISLALWHNDSPLPLTRLPLTLPEPDQSAVLDWIRTHAKDRFGPVRALPPELVFEVDGAALIPAPRRKLGVTLTDPRLIGWCHDLTGVQADHLPAPDLAEAGAMALDSQDQP